MTWNLVFIFKFLPLQWFRLTWLKRKKKNPPSLAINQCVLAFVPRQWLSVLLPALLPVFCHHYRTWFRDKLLPSGPSKFSENQNDLQVASRLLPVSSLTKPFSSTNWAAEGSVFWKCLLFLSAVYLNVGLMGHLEQKMGQPMSPAAITTAYVFLCPDSPTSHGPGFFPFFNPYPCPSYPALRLQPLPVLNV